MLRPQELKHPFPITLSAKPEQEGYDEKENRFIKLQPAIPKTEVTLGHSLLAISKWEAKWEKPYLTNTYEKTPEMVLDYICCMAIDQRDIPAIERVNSSELTTIGQYIEHSMTATTIGGRSKSTRQIITSELVYGLMAQFRIPFSCEKWHLNRLLMLIGVCEELNGMPKKGKASEISRNYAEINRRRLAKSGTKG
jgi:hypothetical protein